LLFSLASVQHVLNTLGNPQNAVPVIHVAGTNGKGSVCALLQAALLASGLSTGLTISPHLITENERIQINGQQLSAADWQAAKAAVSLAENHANPENTLSYFEQCMAMAFWTFAQKKVDFALIETGVGGRLDASNVVSMPCIGVITSIGLDHTEWLGPTLADIAREKAGIIKPGMPVVLGPTIEAPALGVIQAIATQQNSPTYKPLPKRLIPLASKANSLQQQWQDVATGQVISCPLLGSYQHHNVLTALHTLEVLAGNGHPVGNYSHWLKGFAEVSWPGRFQVLTERRLIVDGSHNADGFASLLTSLQHWAGDAPPPMAVLLSLKANRDRALLHTLLGEWPWQQLWVSEGAEGFHNSGMLSRALTDYAPCPVAPVVDYGEALDNVQGWLAENPQRWAVVTGSLYQVGEVLSRVNR
jgi:dihydrofolate synthase / folylpolyglutamate synthase